MTDGGDGNPGRTKGMTYEQIYGAEKAEELKASRRLSNSKRVISAETKKKMSETHRKIIKDPNYRNGMTGKSHSAEVKEFLSKHGKNKWTPELREKLAKQHSKGTYVTPWGNFSSSIKACRHSNSIVKDPGTLREYCINNTKLIKRRGKTGKELGFHFIPK